MIKAASTAKISWFRVLYLLIAAIFIYIVISQISSLRGSVSQLKSSNLSDDVLVFVSIAVTYLFAALTYYLIALKKLHYLRTVIVEVGINTLNRLLPAGIGAIGGNYLYLKNSGHSKVQAATVVAVNNTLGIVGNLLLLAILLSVVKAGHLKVSAGSVHLIIMIVLIASVCLAALYLLPGIKRKFRRGAKLFIGELKQYKQRKFRLSLGLVTQVGLTLGNVVALSFSLHAVGAHLPLSSLMLAYSFAIWLGAVIPAPGGVGSVEAGLVGALVAFNIGLSQAVAAVLVFRLISFWLPLILGIPALVWSRRRSYI